MPGFKYTVSRILKMDYKSFLKTAGLVAKKTGRPSVAILKDMIHCGLKFQAGYNDYLEFEFYLLNEQQRATYLTRGKNNEIVRRYNDKSYRELFENKITFNNTFRTFLRREYLDLTAADGAALGDFVRAHPTFIAKPSGGSGGAGVEKYTVSPGDDMDGLLETLRSKGQDLAEETVLQHPALNTLYPDAVNTMRMFTFAEHGRGHFLQAILKIGNGGVVDNFSSGGMYTFTDENGVVDVPAVDKADNRYTVHPLTGTEIVGFQVPMFREAIDCVERAAQVVPQVGYVGWDVAVGQDGPVIIEGNFYPGVFQRRASFSKDKTGIIPRYREFMEI